MTIATSSQHDRDRPHGRAQAALRKPLLIIERDDGRFQIGLQSRCPGPVPDAALRGSGSGEAEDR
jgi:hypothetical protein